MVLSAEALRVSGMQLCEWFLICTCWSALVFSHHLPLSPELPKKTSSLARSMDSLSLFLFLLPHSISLSPLEPSSFLNQLIIERLFFFLRDLRYLQVQWREAPNSWVGQEVPPKWFRTQSSMPRLLSAHAALVF